MSSVFVIGSVNLDQLIVLDRAPLPGETRLARDSRRLPGGKGGNQAVAAARLGADTRMRAAVGSDPEGRLLVDALVAEGVDVSGVVERGDASGGAILLVSDDGENSIVVVPGANGRLTDEDIEDLASEMSADDVLVAQLEIPIPTVAAGLRAAKAAGAVTVLNAAPMTDIAELIPDVDVLVINGPEAEALLSEPIASMEGAEAAARLLASRCDLAVVITLGAEGAVLASRGEVLVVCAERVDVIDTTGAGDTFVGALSAMLARGRDLPDAIPVAVRAASLACTGFGAQNAMPRPSDLALG